MRFIFTWMVEKSGTNTIPIRGAMTGAIRF